MITVLVDSQHPNFDYYKNISRKYDLKKGFEKNKESFTTIIAQDILSRMNKMEVGEEAKLLALINIISNKINTEDFKKFCSIENEKSRGGIRSISIPQEDINDHILMWSNMYGVIAISRNPMSVKNTHKLEGDFFIAFDTVPPFIMITNTNNPDKNFKILKDGGNEEKDQHLAEVLAEFSRMVFKRWNQYGNQENVENKYEFSFMMRNNDMEC